jgi:hypothetical protein
MLELGEQLQHDGFPRQYTGFDMVLSQVPSQYPENVEFVQHNILVPFPDQYIGSFDVVHVRLLGGALRKDEIHHAVENVLQLLSKPFYDGPYIN